MSDPSIERDDEDWADGSEDEASIAAHISRVDSRASSSTSPATPSAAPPTTTAWSFYPFSLVSPSTAAASSSSTKRISNSSPLPSPALSTGSRRGEALASSSSYFSSKATSGKGKGVENGGKSRSTEAPHPPLPPPTPTTREPEVELSKEEKEELAKKEKTRLLEACKGAVKSNVKDIVGDPAAVLSVFNPAPPPPSSDPDPPTSAASSSSFPSSRPPPPKTNKHDDHEDDDHEEDEDDPAAGYISLNALNLSSGGPQIVEFGKEDELEEDKGERGREKRRRQKFLNCLLDEDVDLAALRKLAWAGIPPELRPIAWQLLLGYLPAPSSRRLATLSRKRQEYADAVRLAFSRGVKGLDGPIWHQISIDVPRTNPGIKLWGCEGAQRALERILYVWAIRHPASGYVQGINDLVTPFFQVFLSAYIESDPEEYDVAALPPCVLEALEADSFWCLSKLLDGIQDNYIFAQPGIQRQVAKMSELCSRVDAPLAKHLVEHNVEFIQFAFRWMNCLLMRELSVKNIVRMWDTYLAEGDHAFSEFHLYVCLAFLVKWSEQLRGMDFQSIIMFLQSLPTQNWTDKNTELLLSEAFMWSRTFDAKKW